MHFHFISMTNRSTVIRFCDLHSNPLSHFFFFLYWSDISRFIQFANARPLSYLLSFLFMFNWQSRRLGNRNRAHNQPLATIKQINRVG